MTPDPTQSRDRRGCLIFGIVALLAVLLLIAISLGWVGPTERAKISDLPVPAANQS
jgi:hypothetical protein